MSNASNLSIKNFFVNKIKEKTQIKAFGRDNSFLDKLSKEYFLVNSLKEYNENSENNNKIKIIEPQKIIINYLFIYCELEPLESLEPNGPIIIYNYLPLYVGIHKYIDYHSAIKVDDPFIEYIYFIYIQFNVITKEMEIWILKPDPPIKNNITENKEEMLNLFEKYMYILDFVLPSRKIPMKDLPDYEYLDKTKEKTYLEYIFNSLKEEFAKYSIILPNELTSIC